jgi:Protein of unknown function (DUF3306)
VSEPENFLTRWARLKREAAETPDDAAPEAAEDAKESRDDAPAAEATASPAPDVEFDLSTLPPIETITAATDIRAFLAPGVPPELTRAALRRAWVADPAIRDFVGIAENQWDFNDPNAIPGFGSLGPLDDVRRLVAQVLGETLDEDAASGAGSAEKTLPAKADNAPDLLEPTTTTGEATPPAAQETSAPLPDVQCNKPDVAVHAAQSEDDMSPQSEPTAKRAHGGALPH